MKAPSLDKSISLKTAGIAFVAIYSRHRPHAGGTRSGGQRGQLRRVAPVAHRPNLATHCRLRPGFTDHQRGVRRRACLRQCHAKKRSQQRVAAPALRLKPPLSGTTGPLGCSLEPPSILTSLPNQPTANPPARQNACHSALSPHTRGQASKHAGVSL